jgi:hypothetical protein
MLHGAITDDFAIWYGSVKQYNSEKTIPDDSTVER